MADAEDAPFRCRAEPIESAQQNGPRELHLPRAYRTTWLEVTGMTDRTCTIDGCDKKHRARGLCSTHYNVATYGARRHEHAIICAHCAKSHVTTRSNGKYCSAECSLAALAPGRDAAKAARRAALAPRAPADRRGTLRRAVEEGDRSAVITAIEANSMVDEAGCWVWQRRVDRHGYPAARLGDRDYMVHRLSLEAHIGKPLGSQPAHHTCANHRCVNPEHLQPVTHRDNSAEMLARTYMVRRITELEAALAQLDANHPLLAEVGIAKP